MAKVTELVRALAQPIAAENGCSIWDVEYVREAGTWFLRVYLDKEGGVTIDDCEAVSRPLSDALDEADPIEGSYTLEVSSAGIDRVLRHPEHFAAFLGAEVEVRLYRPVEGRKDHVGILKGYEDGDVTVELPKGAVTFPKKDVAQVRLYVRV
ncbi:ribosome maturation factor RimP [Pseudoflavonifractor sp. CLA-AP-H29]|uniref:Ribosome maturation factor RimP n=1 Tax=Pseudoflavonifractor intestinihominis TaxID=3133171 RepID=A0ABV1E7F3_9FIRM